MKNVKMFCVLASLVALILPATVFADGAIFPPPNYWVQETDQKAVIFHDENTETMILSVTFRGNAEDFSWIVPTPARPEVTKSTDELFTALAKLTEPEYDYGVMPMYGSVAEDVAPARSGVTVIETKKVEYYDIAVLEASDRDALFNWLKDNKYQFPEDAKYLFDDYLDNQWYFTAVKIDTKSLSGGVEAQLREGHAVPLKFTFTSTNIVYPLKISGIAEYFSYPNPEPVPLMMERGTTESGSGSGVVYGADDFTADIAPVSDYYYPWQPGVNILLYVFADHKKDLPGFTTNYANWVKAKDIENLAIESNGQSWIKTEARKYYLTKLSRYMQPSEMTYDLYLRDTEDNDKVGVSSGNWQNILTGILVFLMMLSIFLVIGILSPLSLIFIVCTLLQFFAKHKVTRIVAWVFQGLTLLITVTLGALLFLGWSAYGVGYWMGTVYDTSMAAAVTAVWAIFTAAMIGIMIWQILRLRKKK